ncbi:MAG: 50S ribosomal protein L21 [Phycisphaerales bacterium]
MYAVIEESGGQRTVRAGDEITIDLLEGGNATKGKQITFDKVLVIGGRDGGAASIGTPYVKGGSVTAEVIAPVVMGQKVDIWKFRTKKNYRRHTGHRQRYTAIKITAING